MSAWMGPAPSSADIDTPVWMEADAQVASLRALGLM
jgi:hypothetical protein